MGLTWEQCCKERAGIARSSAEAIIKNLDEFGPDFFVIAQVTGISAKEYRRIQGAVVNHTLLCAGEEIPIRVENAQQLVTAVETLRREAALASTPPAVPPTQTDRSFVKAERALRTAITELDKLSSLPLDAAGRERLRGVIDETTGTLKMIAWQVKV